MSLSKVSYKFKLVSQKLAEIFHILFISQFKYNGNLVDPVKSIT